MCRGSPWHELKLILLHSCTSSLPLYNGTKLLTLHSSGIESPTSILLNKSFNQTLALLPTNFHTSIGISSGPTALPLFIFLNALSTSPTVTSSTPPTATLPLLYSS